MKKPKDIEPRNSKGKHHGLQTWYNSDGSIMIKGVAKNNIFVGYITNCGIIEDEDGEYYKVPKKAYYIR